MKTRMRFTIKHRQARSELGGFTLIEVLISMTILTIIAFGIYDNTRQSYELRDNIETEGDFYTGVRVALDVLGRDITQLYSPQAAALPGDLGKAKQPNPNQYAAGPVSPPTNFWGEPINDAGVRPSRFQGEATKMSFITNAHVRLFRESQECDFAKISYSVIDEKTPRPGQPTAKVLIKEEDPAAFEDMEKGDTVTKVTLLTGIKDIHFEYLDGQQDKWDRSWDTTGMVHKGTFPDLIKVAIELYVPDSPTKTLKVEQVYRPELPL